MAKRAAIAAKRAKTNAGKKTRPNKPGTPIDDGAVLAKLATALRRSPDLAVAAALRKIGIEDQASLRRIGGKYAKEQAASTRRAAAARRKRSQAGKSRRAEMAAQPLLSETAAIKRSPGKNNTRKTSATARPASTTRSKEATTAKPGRAQSQPAQKTSPNTAASPLLPFVNTGLDLSTAAFQTQLQIYTNIMKMAPVKTMVRQQIEFNQAMVSMFKFPLSSFINGSKKPKSK